MSASIVAHGTGSCSPVRRVVLAAVALLLSLLFVLLTGKVAAAQRPGCAMYEEICFIDDPGGLPMPYPCYYETCPSFEMQSYAPFQMTWGQPAQVTLELDVQWSNSTIADPVSGPVVTATLPGSTLLQGIEGSDPLWSMASAPAAIQAPLPATVAYTFTHPSGRPESFGNLVLNVVPRFMGTHVAGLAVSITGAGRKSDEAYSLIQPAQPGDNDGDALPNTIECELGPPCPDADDDGFPDVVDLDSDNDRVPDLHEHDGVTVTLATIGPPPPPPFVRDSDRDWVPDFRDSDDDNDGTPTAIECSAGPPCPSIGYFLRPDYLEPRVPTEDGTPLRLALLPIVARPEE
jgi:hypothetical protein